MYKFFDEVKNWTDAKRECESQGMILAEPRNAQENHAISREMTRAPVWLGVNYVNNSWRFASDGTNLTFQFWRISTGEGWIASPRSDFKSIP